MNTQNLILLQAQGNNSRLAKLLTEYEKKGRQEPVTMREYTQRMQEIPRLSMRFGQSNGFEMAHDLSDAQMRLITGMVSSRYNQARFQEQMDKPVNVLREMMLYLFEAKPRPISFAITGYTISDFIAYIYQDIALQLTGASAQANEPFKNVVDQIKAWFREPFDSRKNSARRHIRRRLMVTLDRTSHQANSLFEDREMPTEMLYVAHKLLERDDDSGYTQGVIRPFEQVRNDFNLLATYCQVRRYKDEPKKLEAFWRVRCPGEVPGFDFTNEVIDLPRRRARKASHLKKPRVPAKKAVHTLRKAQKTTQPAIHKDTATILDLANE